MTPAHMTEAILTEDGRLSIDHLPFRAGQSVEVIVLPLVRPANPTPSLEGSVIKYDRPSDPVDEADWDAPQ